MGGNRFDELQSQVRRHFDRTAHDYERLNQPAEHDDEDMGFILPHVPRRAVIVDLGCGPGRGVRRAGKAGLDVIGVDLSFGLLGEARKSDPHGRYVQMDGRHLGFKSGSLGCVFARGLLHHTPDPLGVLRDVVRVCAGPIVLVDGVGLGGRLLRKLRIMPASRYQRCPDYPGADFYSELEGPVFFPQFKEVVGFLRSKGYSLKVRSLRSYLPLASSRLESLATRITPWWASQRAGLVAYPPTRGRTSDRVGIR